MAISGAASRISQLDQNSKPADQGLKPRIKPKAVDGLSVDTSMVGGGDAFDQGSSKQNPISEVHVFDVDTQWFEPLGIFIGGLAATSSEILQENTIQVMISLTKNPVPERQRESIKPEDYHHFPVGDVEQAADQMQKILEQSFDIINNAFESGKHVLVHCQQGVSRSATVVIDVLMNKFDLNYLQSLEMLKYSRPCVEPNQGFVRLLDPEYASGEYEHPLDSCLIRGDGRPVIVDELEHLSLENSGANALEVGPKGATHLPAFTHQRDVTAPKTTKAMVNSMTCVPRV